jgi:hypothetical protein
MIVGIVWLAAAVLVGACSGGAGGKTSDTAVTFAPPGQSSASATPSSPGSPSTTTTTLPPATLPPSVDPGHGALAVGPTLVRVGITVCNLTPTTDAATGVRTDVLVSGDDGKGGSLSISQRETSGANATQTVTETITYTSGGNTLESSRIQIGGAYHDLRDPAATGPLFTVNGDTVRGTGLFGGPGSGPGDPTLVSGSLLARCPA